MTSYNRVVLVGNLTRDPALKQAAGTQVADLGLAMNEKVRGRDGQETDKTCFVDVVAWGKQAEACGQYLAKGSPVLVEGSLQFEQWQTKQGERRNKLRVRADRVRFMGRPANGRGKGGGRPSDDSGPEDAPIPF